MIHHRIAAFALVCLFSSLMLSTAAALELAAPFADHAVLQREMKVPVWGWDKAGAKITVTFAGQTKTTTVGRDGKWRVDLDPLAASFEGRDMAIRSDAGGDITLKDVLVGEVWMATGQSNMQWTIAKSDVSRALLPSIQARVEAGEIRQPVVREGKVTDFFSALHPVEHATLAWSSDVNGFSAIATAFACKLAIELQVPVGILNGSFSTTKIQAWIPRVGFRDGKDEYTQHLYQQVLQTDPRTPEHKAAWDAFYAGIEKTIAENKQRIANGQEPQPIPDSPPGNLNGNRDSSWMYNARVNPMVPYAIRGCIWNQGWASIGEGLRYYNNLHSMIRGWRLVWDRPDLPVYFHQFYTNGTNGLPGIGGAGDMRLGTWLASKDIPNVGMASQIDIGGSIHYYNKAQSGRRLALQALNKTYGKDIVADGPMFKSYTVTGDKLIVEFEHADGGLVVGNPDPKNMATATVIPNGEDQVKVFYLADANRVWYLATFKIDGNKVILHSPKVKQPRGVSYGSTGIGFQPNLYNKALLPATPFIYYDHKLVTADSWPEGALKIDGVEPEVVGMEYEYRKMPVLSTQFRDNAVLQAGKPVTIWGSAVHPWVHHGADLQRPEDSKAAIHFTFDDIKKTIPLTPDMLEWQYTLPPMQASDKPHTLNVKFAVNGEVIHEREAKNIVFGDVWYIAASAGKIDVPAAADSGQIVRMMQRQAKRSSYAQPSRFSIAVSTTPDNRFASTWKPAEGFAAALGHRIAAKTNKPVGIIFMQPNSPKGETVDPLLKEWIPAECLSQAPSLMEDYKQLASLRPGNEYYDANARRYIEAWKAYWSDYIAELIRTRAVPDGKAWGSYPRLAGDVDTEASQTYNVLTHSFTPAALKGVVFMTGKTAFEADQGAHYGEQLSALGNCWMKRFASEGTPFFYAMPDKALAPKVTAPKAIKAASFPLPMTQWPTGGKEGAALFQQWIDTIVEQAYP
jgi:sialate O-acetylesterase